MRSYANDPPFAGSGLETALKQNTPEPGPLACPRTPFVGAHTGRCLCRFQAVKDTYSAAAVLCSPGPVSPPLTALADLKVKECRLKPKSTRGGTEKQSCPLQGLSDLKRKGTIAHEHTVLRTHAPGSRQPTPHRHCWEAFVLPVFVLTFSFQIRNMALA